jgi:hypothetical protein
MAQVPLECALCRARKTWQLAGEAATELNRRGACLQRCEFCREDTYWILPSHERAVHPAHRADAPPAAAQRTGPSPRSKRTEQRAPLRLPVRVRVWTLGGLEDITTTKNVSRGGLYFESAVGFQMGQEVRVALNYSAHSREKTLEQNGRIVRVEPAPPGGKRGIAIKYE